jgi:hypothetical protein
MMAYQLFQSFQKARSKKEDVVVIGARTISINIFDKNLKIFK